MIINNLTVNLHINKLTHLFIIISKYCEFKTS